MPVENEDKYVLTGAESLRDALAALHPCDLIEQFYLIPQARMRRTVRFEPGGAASVSLEFTYKQLIEGRLLELPVPVTDDDFALARKAATGTVDKARFSFPGDEPDARWDVDFLLDGPAVNGGRCVFAMAECEYPEGGAHSVPEILRPHVALAVPRGDAHLFSNARLSQPGYADGLLERYQAGWRG